MVALFDIWHVSIDGFARQTALLSADPDLGLVGRLYPGCEHFRVELVWAVQVQRSSRGRAWKASRCMSMRVRHLLGSGGNSEDDVEDGQPAEGAYDRYFGTWSAQGPMYTPRSWLGRGVLSPGEVEKLPSQMECVAILCTEVYVRIIGSSAPTILSMAFQDLT